MYSLERRRPNLLQEGQPILTLSRRSGMQEATEHEFSTSVAGRIFEFCHLLFNWVARMA